MAKSADGTEVPYFVIHRKGLKPDGSTPTILYGYGGFEISLKPGYSATIGKLWLEGVAAHARSRTFAAAASSARAGTRRPSRPNDSVPTTISSPSVKILPSAGITSPKHLGISGGNGGLLVGAIFTQQPDLLNAVVCRVPLLDMIRYTKLLAGASWAAEYGDPKDPKMREAILRYSPYQNVFRTKIPQVFIETSPRTTVFTRATPARWSPGCVNRAMRCCTTKTPRADTPPGRPQATRPSLRA